MSGNVLAEVRKALANSKDRQVAIDTETSQLERPWEATVLGVSMACDAGCWWLPLKALHGEPVLAASAVRDLLQPIMADPKWTLVMQNAPYDLNVLWGFGLTEQRAEVHDLIWMAWALDENRKGRYGLKDQTFDEFGQRQTKWEESELGGGTVPAAQYAKEDAYWTWQLHKLYWSRLDDDLRHYLRELASSTARITARMMRNGLGVDVKFLLHHKEHLDNASARLEARLRSIAPDVDPNSPKQLSEYLFSKKGAALKPFGKRGKSGQWSTDYESLQELVGHPYTDTLLEFRDVEKQLSTYVVPSLERAGRDPHQRIHTNLQIAGTTTGRFSSSNPNCFDGSTEVLTRAGWVPFASLQPSEEVAQWDQGVVSFVRPTGYVKTVQPTITLSNQHIDLRVTADHRCLLRHRKTGELRVFAAMGYPTDWQQLHAGKFAGGQVEVSDAELVLLCATQADGSWQRQRIDFKFKKRRKVVRLCRALDALNVPYTRRPNAGGCTNIIVLDSPVTQRIRGWLGSAKSFGPWLLDFPAAVLDRFCEEVFYWDGCFTRMNHYASSAKVNADWVQTVLTLRGKRAHGRIYRTPTGPSYQVDVTHRDYSLTTNVKREQGAVEPVYCVSVPSSFLLVRRGGQVQVTGNCQNLPREGEIKKAFRARAGFTLVCGDFDQLELRLMAHRSQDPVMLKTYREGGDIHEVTAQAVGCKRPVAKQLNFGIQYGGSAETVERILRVKAGVRVTMEEAQRFRDGWNALYRGVVQYRQTIRREYDRYGFVRTLLGRYRRVRAKARPGSPDDGFGFRQVLNATIQASAADLILLAMRNMQREIEARALKDKRWAQVEQLIQVHDELLLEAPKAIAKDVKAMMERVFSTLVQLSVPLSGKVGIGTTWADAKA